MTAQGGRPTCAWNGPPLPLALAARVGKLQREMLSLTVPLQRPRAVRSLSFSLSSLDSASRTSHLVTLTLLLEGPHFRCRHLDATRVLSATATALTGPQARGLLASDHPDGNSMACVC